jgi:trimethylamine--corrinoid protein Co-methyltransferase
VKPNFEILSPLMIRSVVEEAKVILKTWGVWVEHEEGSRLLLEAGAGRRDDRIAIPERLVERALGTVPPSFSLWDTVGETEYPMQPGATYFAPGSAALELWDPSMKAARKPTTRDLIALARVTNALAHIAFQSTALIASDVPEELADRYRLYIALLYSRKPVVTGTFAEDAFSTMLRLLEAVRGDAPALSERPSAIFDCCPSAPLNWSRLTTDALIRAAHAGLPAELVSMPMAGATGPGTLLGTVVQHCAENLAGVTIHQLAKPGAPVIYGGSPGIMDMRFGTTPMGAIETQMIDTANAQIGTYLHLPTHAYMGLSDSAWPDYQAGAESASGSLLAVLGGTTVVSGPGMLAFESRQSLEKLVLDNEIVGAALRLKEGLMIRETPAATHVMDALLAKGHLLDHDHTRRWFREELYFPGRSMARQANLEQEMEAGGAHSRAEEIVSELLRDPPVPVVELETASELRKIIRADFQNRGATLPSFDYEPLSWS